MWRQCGRDMARFEIEWKAKEKIGFVLVYKDRVEDLINKLDALMLCSDKMCVPKFYEMLEGLNAFISKMDK